MAAEGYPYGSFLRFFYAVWTNTTFTQSAAVEITVYTDQFLLLLVVDIRIGKRENPTSNKNEHQHQHD